MRVRDVTWFKPIGKVVLPPGTPTRRPTKVPAGDAQRILRDVVRLVADLPPGSSPLVVWERGDSQLVVHTDTIGLTCERGLVTVKLAVDCDQIAEPATLSVPLAVGTEEAPAGLVMTALTRLDGPAIVTAIWSEAVTAFAWEALVELARRICAGLGRDGRGRPLVPGGIGAERRVLLIQPMARHVTASRVAT